MYVCTYACKCVSTCVYVTLDTTVTGYTRGLTPAASLPFRNINTIEVRKKRNSDINCKPHNIKNSYMEQSNNNTTKQANNQTIYQ